MAGGTVTAQRQCGQVSGLIQAVWTASALAAALNQPTGPIDEAAGEVLAAAGLAERTPEGWALTPDAAAEVEGPVSVAAALGSTLGQAAAIAAAAAVRANDPANGPADDRTTAGWTRYDDAVLLAQGEMSAPGGLSMAKLIREIPELSALFSQNGVFIDVGVGVAALSCAFAAAMPAARVIGLDIHAPALALARKSVAAKGLRDRVELRLQAVQDLRDENVAGAAHISPPFIDRSVLGEGLARLHRALKPGGRLILSGLTVDGAAGAIGRWQARNAGGSDVTEQQCADLLQAAGFEPPSRLPLPPGAPVVLACRRP
jgi:precorrin-6B methylase 2